jgi:hypothetical protein
MASRVLSTVFIRGLQLIVVEIEECRTSPKDLNVSSPRISCGTRVGELQIGEAKPTVCEPIEVSIRRRRS